MKKVVVCAILSVVISKSIGMPGGTLARARNVFEEAIANDISDRTPYDIDCACVDFGTLGREKIKHVKVNKYRRPSEIMMESYFKTNGKLHKFKARVFADIYNNAGDQRLNYVLQSFAYDCE